MSLNYQELLIHPPPSTSLSKTDTSLITQYLKGKCENFLNQLIKHIFNVYHTCKNINTCITHIVEVAAMYKRSGPYWI